jgi:hypothetical protein
MTSCTTYCVSRLPTATSVFVARLLERKDIHSLRRFMHLEMQPSDIEKMTDGKNCGVVEITSGDHIRCI